MVKKLVVVSTLVLHCLVALAQSQEPSPPPEEKETETIFEFVIHKDLKQMAFHLFSDEAGDTHRIEIYREGEPEPFQKIDVEPSLTQREDAEFFKSMDMNFDGYADILLMSWWGAQVNEGFEVWTYGASKGLFEYDCELSDLVNPGVDESKREIGTYYRGSGWGRGGTETLKYVNGELVIIEDEEWDYFEEQNVSLHVRRRRIDGVLKLVEVEQTSENRREVADFLRELPDTLPQEDVLAALRRGVPDITAVNEYFDRLTFLFGHSERGALLMETIAETIADSRPSSEKNETVDDMAEWAVRTLGTEYASPFEGWETDGWKAVDIWTKALMVQMDVVPSYGYEKYKEALIRHASSESLLIRARALDQIHQMYCQGHEFPLEKVRELNDEREQWLDKPPASTAEMPDFVRRFHEGYDFSAECRPEQLLQESEYWAFVDATPEQKAEMASRDSRYARHLTDAEDQ